MNIMQMVNQAKKMQSNVMSAKDELANIDIVGESAGGAVKYCCDGMAKFKYIKILPEAICPENPSSIDTETIEMLEDMISAAINQANDKASAEMEAKMKQATGGLNIPGLF